MIAITIITRHIPYIVLYFSSYPCFAHLAGVCMIINLVYYDMSLLFFLFYCRGTLRTISIGNLFWPAWHLAFSQKIRNFVLTVYKLVYMKRVVLTVKTFWQIIFADFILNLYGNFKYFSRWFKYSTIFRFFHSRTEFRSQGRNLFRVNTIISGLTF